MRIDITKQLALIALSLDDDKEIFTLVEQNRNTLKQYLYWVNEVEDLSGARRYIDVRVSSTERGASWYKIVLDNKAVGIFGIKSIDHQSSIAEVGYWLSSHAHKQGIISKALAIVGKKLKYEQQVRFIEIHCLAENTASISVAERAGGYHSKTLPDYLKLNGQLQDLKIYTVSL